MASDNLTPTRWRPRFSVRTLVVIVTLVCAYAACWGPTKKWGEDWSIVQSGFGYSVAHSRAIAPLLVSRDVYVGPPLAAERHYYFWFFGYRAKLPYEREIDADQELVERELIRKLEELDL